MTEIKKAAFSLENFKICKFSLDLDNHDTTNAISVDFNPSGIFYQKDQKFELILDFIGYQQEKSKSYINARMHAYFQFENVEEISQIPDYFYRNGIAIVFPYLRSFISSLSLQANAKLLVLPTMNLGALEVPLKEKTISK